MWKTELRRTGMRIPETGEPAYVYVKIRPAWYWALCRMRLFLKIVWRRFDTEWIDRATAWQVSKVAKGPTK